MTPKKIRQGSIATDSKGHVGLVISKTSKITWTGLHLDSKRFGQLWESRKPLVLGHIDSYLNGDSPCPKCRRKK